MFGLVGLFGLQVGDFFFHFHFLDYFFGIWCSSRFLVCMWNAMIEIIIKIKIMKINAHKDTLN